MERGRGVRGLRRISLCDCCQGYGIAKGTVDMCGYFAEAFEGCDCYSDAGWVVAGVRIVVGHGSWLFVLVWWWGANYLVVSIDSGLGGC